MSADEIMRAIGKMGPEEIERSFVLIKKYEVEARRRQTKVRYVSPTDFGRAVEMVFVEDKQLRRNLAEREKSGRGVAAP